MDGFIPFAFMMLAWIIARVHIYVLNRDYEEAIKGWKKATSVCESTFDRLDEVNAEFRCLSESYKELADHYHELCVAYTRAYAILEENDLLPGDMNEPDAAE